MSASSPEFALSLAGIAVLASFVCVFALLHVFVAGSKSSPRLKYFLFLAVAFFATLFVPVVDGGAKFGWIPVSLAYVIVPHSIFRTGDDLTGIFALCYAVIAVQHILCIGVAHMFTLQNKNA